MKSVYEDSAVEKLNSTYRVPVELIMNILHS